MTVRIWTNSSKPNNGRIGIDWNNWMNQTKDYNANNTFASLHKMIADIMNEQSKMVPKRRRQNPKLHSHSIKIPPSS